MTDAADRVDRQLARSPTTLGESRAGNDYVCHHAPLGVEFRVDDDDRRVVVVRVWRF